MGKMNFLEVNFLKVKDEFSNWNHIIHATCYNTCIDISSAKGLPSEGMPTFAVIFWLRRKWGC